MGKKLKVDDIVMVIRGKHRNSCAKVLEINEQLSLDGFMNTNERFVSMKIDTGTIILKESWLKKIG